MQYCEKGSTRKTDWENQIERTTMIAIIEYGVGNLFSLQSSL